MCVPWVECGLFQDSYVLKAYRSQKRNQSMHQICALGLRPSSCLSPCGDLGDKVLWSDTERPDGVQGPLLGALPSVRPPASEALAPVAFFQSLRHTRDHTLLSLQFRAGEMDGVRAPGSGRSLRRSIRVDAGDVESISGRLAPPGTSREPDQK